MIFVTVGSSYPFDRLIRAVDDLAQEIDEDFFAQIGDGPYEPRHVPFSRMLDKAAFDQHLREASMVIGHAGMGTISGALSLGKPLLVMPRLANYGELVNNHQVATADHFEAGGHVLVARDGEPLAPLVERLRDFVPRPRVVDPEAVALRIAEFIGAVDERQR